MNTKNLIKLTLSILFLACLLDWEYGYFQFVRFIGMTGFIWLYFIDKEIDNINKYIWIFSALLINPFIKVSLGREIWNTVDVFWVVIFLITYIIEKRN